MRSYTSHYLLARAIAGGANLVSVALFTHLVAPGSFGQYSLIVAAVALGEVAFFYWIRAAVSRFAPSPTESQPQLRAAVLRAFIVTACVVCLGVALGLLVAIKMGALEPYAFYLLPVLIAYGWFELNVEFARATFRPQEYLGLVAARAGALLVFGVGFVILGADAVGLAMALFLSSLGPGLWSWSRQWRGIRPPIEPDGLKRLARYGVPVTIGTALTTAILFTDRLVIGLFVGADAVGPYAAAYELAWQATIVAMVSVWLAAFPVAAHAFDRGDKTLLIRTLGNTQSTLVALGAPVVVVLIACLGNIVHIVYGASFRTEVEKVIPTIAIAAFLGGLRMFYFDIVFQVTKRAGLLARLSLLLFLLNLILNLLAVPAYGSQGAAYATLVSMIVGLVANAIVARGLLEIPVIDRNTLKALCCNGVLFAAITLLPGEGVDALSIQLAIGGLLYFGSLVLLDVGSSRATVSRVLAMRTS